MNNREIFDDIFENIFDDDDLKISKESFAKLMQANHISFVDCNLFDNDDYKYFDEIGDEELINID
jgi:hypothetical protein